MTEWTVVTVVVALVGLVVAVAGPLIKLNTTLAKLDANVDALRGEMKSLTTRNSESHDRIFKRLDETDTTINDHETRITVLETAKGGQVR